MVATYLYYSMNRLTGEDRGGTGERYAYDLCGNRLRKQNFHVLSGDTVIDSEESYCYNERNELAERIRAGSLTACRYDKNGSLISEKEGGKETAYGYDLLNRQTTVSLPDGRKQENLYDGENLRAGLMENGKKTTFLFHNGEIFAESDGESAPIRRYLRGKSLCGIEETHTGMYHSYY